MIGRMPFVAIARFQLLQIQLLHRAMHEKAKVPFSQHFSHGWWQQVSLLRAVLQKLRHPALLLSRQYKGSVKPSCHTDAYTPRPVFFVSTDYKGVTGKMSVSADSARLKVAVFSAIWWRL